MWRKGKFGVLVVDDEPSVLMTYRLILEKQGYAVHVAETAAKAIELIGQYRYDLLLCDYSLEQERTGFEVIQAARAVDPNISALLLTGYASKDTVERAQADHISVLFKPIDIGEFFRTVNSLKKEKHAEDEQQSEKSSEQTRKNRAAN